MRRRFAEAAREERPDLALLCLLIGAEAQLSQPRGRTGGPGTGKTDATTAGTGKTEPRTTGTGKPGVRGTDSTGKPDEAGEPDATDEPGEAGRPDEAGTPTGAGESDGAAEAEIDRIVDEGQAELDRLAGMVPYERGRTPAQWARALERLLGDRLGFGGTASDYQRLESSLLPRVLRRRRGLPILLSVVWTEVARRAGAPVYGVALPGHFVVGFGDPPPAGAGRASLGGHVLADPFGGGRLLGEEELSALVAGATGGAPVTAASLQPAGPLETVLRVLNNIRAWAGRRPEQVGVRLWAVELSLLLPHHPGRLRFERAQLLVERGDFVRGAREMEEYADVIAAMEPNAAENMRRAARAARARLN
ncbi:tetratricopeptide repeat protein [Streptomyces albus subsp. chlorinus]|nr:transglutaminase-like domain-containing protein [Streptomyces albus]NSC23716.1 tetratricopeptide repeat protein [Streptomyces albus subsp. chlorinus]